MHKLVNNFAHHHHEIAGQGVLSASNTCIRKSQTVLILRGEIESARIKQVEFRENVRTFIPQG